MKTEVHASEVIDALYSQYLYDSCEADVMVDFCVLLLSFALWMLQILKTDHKYFWTCTVCTTSRKPHTVSPIITNSLTYSIYAAVVNDQTNCQGSKCWSTGFPLWGCHRHTGSNSLGTELIQYYCKPVYWAQLSCWLCFILLITNLMWRTKQTMNQST